MNTFLFVLLAAFGIIAIAIAAFVLIILMEAAFGFDNQDMFDLEEEDI